MSEAAPTLSWKGEREQVRVDLPAAPWPGSRPQRVCSLLLGWTLETLLLPGGDQACGQRWDISWSIS